MQANAVTITFNDPGLSESFQRDTNSLETQGYIFSAGLDSPFFDIAPDSDPFLVLFGSETGETLSITEASGSTFSLSSLEFYSPAVEAISFIGYLEGGGTVQLGLISGSSPETFNFDGSWSNLTGIDVYTGATGFQLDNIVVTAVPVPAAVWLFGSALAGLGWMRRKQTV
jgi:hypothetical protein